MNTQDVMAMTPETLAIEQKKLLKLTSIRILKQMQDYLKKEDWESAENMLGFSPAGDGMGDENHFIDFADALFDGADIGNVIERLKDLDTIINVGGDVS